MSSYEHVSRKDMLLYLIYKLTEVSYMDLKRLVSLAEDEGVPFKYKEIERLRKSSVSQLDVDLYAMRMIGLIEEVKKEEEFLLGYLRWVKDRLRELKETQKYM